MYLLLKIMLPLFIAEHQFWESIQFVYSKIIHHPHLKQLPFVVQTVLPTYDMKIQNENMTTSNMPVSIGQFIYATEFKCQKIKF